MRFTDLAIRFLKDTLELWGIIAAVAVILFLAGLAFNSDTNDLPPVDMETVRDQMNELNSSQGLPLISDEEWENLINPGVASMKDEDSALVAPREQKNETVLALIKYGWAAGFLISMLLESTVWYGLKAESSSRFLLRFFLSTAIIGWVVVKTAQWIS